VVRQHHHPAEQLRNRAARPGHTAGPDGALWFTNQRNNTVGRIDPATGAVANYAGPGISEPYGITTGPDGALWFTNQGNSTIGRIDPATGAVTSFPPVPTTTTVAAAPDPVSYGQTVTFTATVSPTDGGGSVAFSADGTPVAGCSAQPLTLASGFTYQAVCTTSALAADGHTITATYSGDTDEATSTGSTGVSVEPLATTTTLASGTNPSTYGQPVTFTATVSPTDGGGSVSFTSGTSHKTTPCASQGLTLAGGTYQATCTVSTLPAGTTVITATYRGDTDYSSSSATVKQTVNKTPTTTVSSSLNPSAYGQDVTFTAAVSQSDTAGTVTFWTGGNTIPGCTSEPLQDNAGASQATCTTSLPGGTHKVSAVYSGDHNCFRSTGTITQVVTRTMTATSLTAAPSPSATGQTVTLTAIVSPTDGAGTVTFTSQGQVISGCFDVQLTLAGDTYQAICTTSALATGTDTLKAAYSGDPAFSPSSGTKKQKVNPT
jgi:hypothetical protein